MRRAASSRRAVVAAAGVGEAGRLNKSRALVVSRQSEIEAAEEKSPAAFLPKTQPNQLKENACRRTMQQSAP